MTAGHAGRGTPRQAAGGFLAAVTIGLAFWAVVAYGVRAWVWDELMRLWP